MQINRRNILGIAATILTGHVLLAGIANAQQPSDIEALKAANQAFYAALSARDSKAMEAVWANKPYVVNIGPRSTTIAVGYTDAVADYWPRVFDLFSQIAASMTSIVQVQTDGKLAWLVGTESALLHPKNGGEPSKLDIFATNIFEKAGNRWLMISHQAQVIPK